MKHGLKSIIIMQKNYEFQINLTTDAIVVIQ